MVCAPAATAPIIAEPSSTGSGVSGASTVLPQTSAMIWRTNALLRGAAADDDRIEIVAGPLELADDVGYAIGQAAEAGDIEFLQARRVFAQVHPHDAAARARVGQRRSAADEVGQDMQALGDQGRIRQAAGSRDDVLLERCERVRPRARLDNSPKAGCSRKR